MVVVSTPVAQRLWLVLWVWSPFVQFFCHVFWIQTLFVQRLRLRTFFWIRNSVQRIGRVLWIHMPVERRQWHISEFRRTLCFVWTRTLDAGRLGHVLWIQPLVSLRLGRLRSRDARCMLDNWDATPETSPKSKFLVRDSRLARRILHLFVGDEMISGLPARCST